MDDMHFIPNGKYSTSANVSLPNRQWPSREITQAPIWLSTDLRDGNQAIFDPMSVAAKLEFFQRLVQIGFKEVEIGFPSASQIEFDFVRMLIEEGHIPDDVTIQVLTQARPELIERTMESLRGAKQAIVHIYTATAPAHIKTVFNMAEEEVTKMAVDGVALIKKLAAEQPQTRITLEYSPEMFTQTPLPFARDICNAVVNTWGATPERKVILNLPSTVEVCRPNVFADKIELMGNNLEKRDSVIISIHTHNDRGTGVAASEMALLAGADRVEGCLFGNGERTGNADLVNLALNMQTDGIDTGLDFSNLDSIARMAEKHTGIPIPLRHPYAGDLAFTAFSGSHQDAMKKGFAAMKEGEPWEVSYLLIDPRKIGRSLTNLIRVNSQSGKGGISYILESEKGIEMPRRLQIEFSGVVQKHAEETGKEVSANEICSIFQQEYIAVGQPIKFIDQNYLPAKGNQPKGFLFEIEIADKSVTLFGEGNGPIDAFVHALKLPIDIQDLGVKSIGKGSGADAVAFIEMSVEGHPGTHYGVGIHHDSGTASLVGIINGINRAIRAGRIELPANFAKGENVIHAPDILRGASDIRHSADGTLVPRS